MKRKILSLMLSMALAISITACGSNSASQELTEGETVNQEEVAAEPTEEESIEEASGEVITEEKTQEDAAEAEPEETTQEDVAEAEPEETTVEETVEVTEEVEKVKQETWPDDMVIEFDSVEQIAEIRYITQKMSGDITYGDIKNIDSITWEETSDKLKYFTGLEELVLSYNYMITNLNGIENLV